MRVALVGFAGSGKTTVGRLVADALAVPWLDLDAWIEGQAGRPVPEIFTSEGEAGFRAREWAAVLELLDRPGDVVLSLGGGTLGDADVRREVLARALVVALHVSVETAVARIAGSGQERPLLARGDARVRARELLTARAGLYGLAHAGVRTEGRSAEAVAREVVAIARGEAVPVSLGERSYQVWVGRGLVARAPQMLVDAGLGGRSVALVCDRAIAHRFGGPLLRGLRRTHGQVLRLVQPPGETQKTLRSATRLLGRILGASWERTDPVVALGGGVVSDLAGFVAAVALRGVPFVTIPTTLLAQADASIGGKVGVDHPAGKNLVGALHQPRLVVADLDTLATLPRRQLRAGLAEIVKCGVVRDEVILDRLEAAVPALAAGEIEPVLEPLRRAIAVKAGIVSRDELEAGERRVLNFGHTVGHAIETVERYRGMLHGEAVAVGMVAALRLGRARGVTPPALVERTVALLSALELPVAIPPALRPDRLAAAMARDKKVVGGAVRFVVAAGGGTTEEVVLRPEEIVADVGQ